MTKFSLFFYDKDREQNFLADKGDWHNTIPITLDVSEAMKCKTKHDIEVVLEDIKKRSRIREIDFHNKNWFIRREVESGCGYELSSPQGLYSDFSAEDRRNCGLPPLEKPKRKAGWKHDRVFGQDGYDD